jgi:hypothetical protein
MTQVPLDETMQGYQAPFTKQFSVFLDNRCGKLLELLETFEGELLRVVALSVIDSSDHAVVRIVTTCGALARQLLQRHKLPFAETDILVAELSAGQTLNRMCTVLLSAEVSINYAYPLMVRPHGAATIALHADDLYLAGQILLRKGFVMLGENDLVDSEGPGGLGSDN